MRWRVLQRVARASRAMARPSHARTRVGELARLAGLGQRVELGPERLAGRLGDEVEGRAAEEPVARRAEERRRRRVGVGDPAGIGLDREERVGDPVDGGGDRAPARAHRRAAGAARAFGAPQREDEAREHGLERRAHRGRLGAGHPSAGLGEGAEQRLEGRRLEAQAVEGRRRLGAVHEGGDRVGAQAAQPLGLG